MKIKNTSQMQQKEFKKFLFKYLTVQIPPRNNTKFAPFHV